VRQGYVKDVGQPAMVESDVSNPAS
jgi:hypothetical protein